MATASYREAFLPTEGLHPDKPIVNRKYPKSKMHLTSQTSQLGPEVSAERVSLSHHGQVESLKPRALCPPHLTLDCGHYSGHTPLVSKKRDRDIPWSDSQRKASHF